jgi:phosphate/sulfate permease
MLGWFRALMPKEEAFFELFPDARKTAAVRRNVASDVVLAWIVTLPADPLFGSVFYELYKLLS